VEAGAGVLIVEAMKMENEVKAPFAGIVRDVQVAEGESVEAQQFLARVEAHEESA
jgi:biotin carboxyl carrier protein